MERNFPANAPEFLRTPQNPLHEAPVFATLPDLVAGKKRGTSRIRNSQVWGPSQFKAFPGFFEVLRSSWSFGMHISASWSSLFDVLLWPKNLICLDSHEHREVQAEAMVDQTEGVDNLKWFDFASTCMSDSTWEIAVKRPTSSLSHRTCPWGGHLIRFDNRTPTLLDLLWLFLPACSLSVLSTTVLRTSADIKSTDRVSVCRASYPIWFFFLLNTAKVCQSLDRLENEIR